jgi:hypothetical protein
MDDFLEQFDDLELQEVAGPAAVEAEVRPRVPPALPPQRAGYLRP